MQIKQTEFINTIIRAGAGAGKTYGLIQKIVQLFREFNETNPNSSPRFVVTTFTRKATQEVRERLLTKALEIRQIEPQFGENLLSFLKSSGSLSVSTIHGVLNQFLRLQGQHIGLDPDFEISSFPHLLFTQVFHDLISHEPQIADLIKCYGIKKIKQFLLQYHRSYLFNPDLRAISLDDIVEFWTQDLNQLLQEASHLQTFLQNQREVKKPSATLIKLESVLNDFILAVSRPASVWDRIRVLITASSDFPFQMGSLANWPEEAKMMKRSIGEKIKNYQNNPWCEENLLKDFFNDLQKLSHIGPLFSQKWLSLKIREQSLELEDLEFLALFILRRFPDTAKDFSSSWHYWFIDEYQDTSPIQVEILNHLIGECPHYIVGDPQQSIYFFRGARSKVFHQKWNSFSQSGFQIEFKKINRRSLTPTLEFINDLVQNVSPHQFSPMESLPENHHSDKSVGYFYLFDREATDEVTYIESIVSQLLKEDIDPSTVGILCRENSDLLHLYQHLNKRGIPCQLTSKVPFDNDPWVHNALALWHFLVNPFDDTNLSEVLRSPAFQIEDRLLFDVTRLSGPSLWDKLQSQNDRTIDTLRMALADLDEKGHFEVWQNLIFSSCFFEMVCRQDPSGKLESKIWRIISHIATLSQQGRLDFINPMKIEPQTDQQSSGEVKPIRSHHGIQLMTIHASKGLEFDHVILPFLDFKPKTETSGFLNLDLEHQKWSILMKSTRTQEWYSSPFADENDRQVNETLNEESERLFYVAITRAKKTLRFVAPNAPDLKVKKNWLNHISPYLEKGIGSFCDDLNRFEFKVLMDPLASPGINSQTNFPGFQKQNLVTTPYCRLDSIIENVPHFGKPTPDRNANPSTPYSLDSASLIQRVKAIQLGVQSHRVFERFNVTKSSSSKLNHLTQVIENAPFDLNHLILNGRSEWPFIVNLNNVETQGRIDLWGRDTNDVLWIIDYKTGSSRYANEAFEQLHNYAQALLKCGHVRNDEPVNLVLFYTGEEKFKVKTIVLGGPNSKNGL